MRRRTGGLLVVGGVVGVIGLLWLVVVAAPPWFIDGSSLDRLKAQNEVRTTLLQGLAGLVLLVGAAFTYTQLRTAREGQITERYTRAIDQLGHPELDVRIGGVYALERIARDSLADRRTIVEVLTAFVRSHAPWPPTRPGQYVATAGIHEIPELQARAPDVQACLTVLGRGGFVHAPGRGRIDLHAADLRRANLDRADLSGVDLNHADLSGAALGHAGLPGASLYNANLFRAGLPSANLSGADLGVAKLSAASLSFANLSRAHMGHADLSRAFLNHANLSGVYLGRASLVGADLAFANLSGADLGDADLSHAHLSGASADAGTKWPAGFDWRAAGVRLKARPPRWRGRRPIQQKSNKALDDDEGP